MMVTTPPQATDQHQAFRAKSSEAEEPLLPSPTHPSALLTDEQLVNRFLHGDRSALDQLFLRYRAVAYRVAYRLLGREADALDAVQDGFVNALTHLEGFRRCSSFKTWLLRIVSNAALDVGRQRRRIQTRDQSDRMPLTEFPAMVARSEFELDQPDIRRRIDGALALLPEPQRRAFVLHVDGGLSYREVAETMGISIGTVMSRLHYARQKLQGLLADILWP